MIFSMCSYSYVRVLIYRFVHFDCHLCSILQPCMLDMGKCKANRLEAAAAAAANMNNYYAVQHCMAQVRYSYIPLRIEYKSRVHNLWTLDKIKILQPGNYSTENISLIIDFKIRYFLPNIFILSIYLNNFNSTLVVVLFIPKVRPCLTPTEKENLTEEIHNNIKALYIQRFNMPLLLCSTKQHKALAVENFG